MTKKKKTSMDVENASRLLIDREKTRSARDFLVLGLGANLPGPLGSPRATLTWALVELGRLFGPLAVAPVYAGVALNRRGDELAHQPEYLNTVVLARLEGRDPRDVYRQTARLELRAGRPPDRTIDAPRPLDIDLLLCGDQTLDEDLILPHPRMRERRFVLRPLWDLAPNLTLPPDDVRIEDLLHRLGRRQPLRRIDLNEESSTS